MLNREDRKNEMTGITREQEDRRTVRKTKQEDENTKRKQSRRGQGDRNTGQLEREDKKILQTDGSIGKQHNSEDGMDKKNIEKKEKHKKRKTIKT